MTAHAPFAPSSLSRLMACAGSYELVRHYPEEEEGPAAKEGTAAHWVAERLLTDGELVPTGTIAPNGVEVTEEMTEGAELYVRTVRRLVPVGGAVEQRIATGLHPDCWGTPDFVGINAGFVIHVVDYKFGHRYVDEFENWQLLAYAAGSVDFVFTSADIDTEVHLTVVQPRCYDRRGTVRTWRITVNDLYQYAARIRGRLSGIASGELRECVTGPHCYMCSARRGCAALQQAGYLACDIVGQPEPLDLPPQALGLELAYLQRAAELLKQRIAGLEEQATATLQQGTAVPGWHIKSKPGRERWKAGTNVAALGQLYGVELTKTEPITPTQARKKLPDAALLDPMTERPTVTALEQDDMRSVARIFQPEACK